MMSAPSPATVAIISAPTITMKPTPIATRAPERSRGVAAGRMTLKKSAGPRASIVRAARTSTGSTYFAAAIALVSITQKQA